MTPDPNSTDWSTSYSQYLARSAALSARTLNLYQLALERVSQGKLPPTIFQDHLPAFAAAHAGELSQRLSEVGSRFLSDLVRLGASYARQQPNADSVAAEQEIVPPKFDAANPAGWYEQLADYAGQLNARAVKIYRAQLDRVAAGEATPSEVQQHAAEQMAQQLPNYMQVMTQLYFDLLNGLNEVRSTYEETYFHGLLAATRPSDETAPVTLTAPLGATAAASLSITNTTGQPSRIDREVAEVRRVDGAGPSLIPAIVFVPETLELGPEEEGTLTISVQLDPEQYDPDVIYAGRLYLTGGSEVPLEIDLRILATSGASNAANGQG